MTTRRLQRGVTLLEVLIAVTLLGLLSAGGLMSMRMGLDAMDRTGKHFADEKRVVGAQRTLQNQILGFIPAIGLCAAGPDAPPSPAPFFQGEPQTMRFVSAYSLNESWRGYPRILEYQVIPREGGGFRLVVNEHLYSGPRSAGYFCLGRTTVPETGATMPGFRPVQVGAGSFVLADQLADCRFVYLDAPAGPQPATWRSVWVKQEWPRAIRVEMTPMQESGGRSGPSTLQVPLHVDRIPIFDYVD